MKEFIENFAAQFEETTIEQFNDNTVFKSLGEWDSMTALMIIAMVDEKYGKKISGNDLRNANTLADLYNLIQSK